MRYILILLLTALLPSVAFGWGYQPHRGCYWEATEAECAEAKAEYEERDRKYKASDEYKEMKRQVSEMMLKYKEEDCGTKTIRVLRDVLSDVSGTKKSIGIKRDKDGNCLSFTIDNTYLCDYIDDLEMVLVSHPKNRLLCVYEERKSKIISENIDYIYTTKSTQEKYKQIERQVQKLDDWYFKELEQIKD